MTLNENAQKQFDRELVKEYYGQARARGKILNT